MFFPQLRKYCYYGSLDFIVTNTAQCDDNDGGCNPRMTEFNGASMPYNKALQECASLPACNAVEIETPSRMNENEQRLKTKIYLAPECTKTCPWTGSIAVKKGIYFISNISHY